MRSAEETDPTVIRICSCSTTSLRHSAPIDSFMHLIKYQPIPSVPLKRWFTTGLGSAIDGAVNYAYTDAEKRELTDIPENTLAALIYLFDDQ